MDTSKIIELTITFFIGIAPLFALVKLIQIFADSPAPSSSYESSKPSIVWEKKEGIAYANFCEYCGKPFLPDEMLCLRCSAPRKIMTEKKEGSQ